jgi:uncharacterized damage-inducible protein DinB
MPALQKLARYKAWANELLYAALAKIPETELAAPQPIVFGSLLRTLNHVLAMDHVWQSHLLGRPHGLTSRNPDSCPPFGEIAAAQRDMDRWYIDYVDALADTAQNDMVAFTFIGGNPGAMTRGDIVLHAVNHGSYHRGHIAQMMRAWQPPPITDYPVFLQELARA